MLRLYHYDMLKIISLETPANFSFKYTVGSHGWSDLPPFVLDEETGHLSYVFTDGKSGNSVSARISDGGGKLDIEIPQADFDRDKLIADVRHIFRLDDDLNDFYTAIANSNGLAWVANANAGRLLRSATVFEDLVKTLCTTNCSWALTRKMTLNLVEKIGLPAADGKKAFPTPEALGKVSEDFFRSEIRAGYRSPFFVELAESVAGSRLDPESWLRSELPTAELKKEIKSIKGIGDYAAENLLKLLGRYDGLALDSWLRGQFYKKHNREKVCADKKIEKHYRKFGVWQGLAMWCDMTEKWFDEKV